MKELNIAKGRLLKRIIKTNWPDFDLSKLNTDKPIFNFNQLHYIFDEGSYEEGRKYNEQTADEIYNEKKESKLKAFMHYLFTERNLKSYDSMILLTSPKGLGKSTAAIQMAKEWVRLRNKLADKVGFKRIPFNPNRHIAYSNADMMNKIDELDAFEPLIADEAVNFATSEDWNKKQNKLLKKKLAQVRTKRLLFILCFPLQPQKLDKTYLASFVNYWINLYARGKGVVFIKNQNLEKDRWRLSLFEKIGKFTEFTPVEQILKTLKKHPNFWDKISMPNLTKNEYKRYLKIRDANVYNDTNVLAAVGKEDIYTALLLLALRDVLTNDATLTIERIILHIKNQYDIVVPKAKITAIINDAKQLVNKIKEVGENDNTK